MHNLPSDLLSMLSLFYCLVFQGYNSIYGQKMLSATEIFEFNYVTVSFKTGGMTNSCYFEIKGIGLAWRTILMFCLQWGSIRPIWVVLLIYLTFFILFILTLNRVPQNTKHDQRLTPYIPYFWLSHLSWYLLLICNLWPFQMCFWYNMKLYTVFIWV